MPDDTFPVAMAGGVTVVATPEEIDITNADALRSALLMAAASGHGAVVVDMTRTQFCDSSGLHTLLGARKRAEAEGREVLLVMGGPAVLRVFTLTCMGRLIPSFTTLAEALAHTGCRAGQPQLGWEPVTDPGQATAAGAPAPTRCGEPDP